MGFDVNCKFGKQLAHNCCILDSCGEYKMFSCFMLGLAKREFQCYISLDFKILVKSIEICHGFSMSTCI